VGTAALKAGPIAFIANFDAHDELRLGAHYAGPRPGMRATLATLAQRAAPLAREQDVLIVPPADAVCPTAVRGTRAFCPTPFAKKLARDLGLPPLAGPEFDVLRRANHRGTWHGSRWRLQGSVFAMTAEEARAHCGRGRWLAKSPYAFAGRGHRRLGPSQEWSAADGAWVERTVTADGGLWIEPWVAIEAEFALHGYVTRDGTVIGEPTMTVNAPSGAWVRSERVDGGSLLGGGGRQLREALIETAGALVDLGYWGPFGIDAHRHRLADGSAGFCARSDVNARYTMGWAVGMGDLRPDL
jgi:hypothetical protein